MDMCSKTLVAAHAFGQRSNSHPPAELATTAWRTLAAIDLQGCDRSRPADPDRIRRFVACVIDAIGMRAHGPLALDRFGDGDLGSWPAVQFIETSSITVHADEVSARCFVDVFSCRAFEPADGARVAVEHLGGTATVRVLER